MNPSDMGRSGEASGSLRFRSTGTLVMHRFVFLLFWSLPTLLLLLGSTSTLSAADGTQTMHGVVLDEMDSHGQGFVLHNGVKFAVLYDEEQSKMMIDPSNGVY
jgi:hypothetical protein